ncbi:FAD-binding oxidoreductase, partial [Bacillus sp. ZZQ-131]
MTSDTFPQLPLSYWIESTQFPTFPRLSENIKAKVAIIGAGITGITTAYLLAKEGIDVVLIDSGRILNGTTGHTTAKVTAQHDLIYDELINHFGVEKAGLYYESNNQALQFIN